MSYLYIKDAAHLITNVMSEITNTLSDKRVKKGLSSPLIAHMIMKHNKEFSYPEAKSIARYILGSIYEHDRVVSQNESLRKINKEIEK